MKSAKYLMWFILFPLYVQAAIPQKAILCGICRDVGPRLPHTIKIMEQIGALFEDYRIVIYENNSTDNTKQLLVQWTADNPKVHAKMEDCSHSQLAELIVNLKEDQHFFRPEEIARARNIVLDIATSQAYDAFPYLIWMDMDFKIPPAFEGIAEAFETTREWDAVLAYGIAPDDEFWDWYAFRDAIYPIGSELLGNHWWYMPKAFSMTSNNDWHPVYSAFGGCGIYKKSSIEGCRYSALVTRDLESVARQIIDQGKASGHPQILHYLSQNARLRQILTIPSPIPHLSKVTNPHIGFILHPEVQDPLLWKMSSFVYQYPSVCEHVPFHASMIARGHNKIYINPRMVFRYGG